MSDKTGNAFSSLNKNFAALNLGRTFQTPRVSVPDIRIPTKEEQHEYESSGVLIRRLASTIRQWRSSIPENTQPVVLAILTNGANIRVDSLTQQGHNGIMIQGCIGSDSCMVVAHQATLQLLCYVEQLDKPEEKRKPIGFHYYGQEEEI